MQYLYIICLEHVRSQGGCQRHHGQGSPLICMTAKISKTAWIIMNTIFNKLAQPYPFYGDLPHLFRTALGGGTKAREEHID